MTNATTSTTEPRYSRDQLIDGPLLTREAVDALEGLRDDAAAQGDLAETLLLDDRLEDTGMHGDDRRSCHPCKDWADHRHNPRTGRRLPAGA